MSQKWKGILLVIGASLAIVALVPSLMVTSQNPSHAQLLGPAQSGPQGATGATGATGPQGAAGVNAIGAPTSRSVSLATAYQASDPTKPAFVNVAVSCTATIALGSPATNTVELHIGPNNTVASGGGTIGDVYSSTLSVSIIISIGWTGQAVLKSQIPTGYYFAAVRTAGTGCTITSAFDQSVG